MATSSDPLQKHAFLFTGNTAQRYIEDLKKVFVTLSEFYNYPAGNIYVVSGDAALSPSDFPGAVIKRVDSLNGTTDLHLQKHLSDFRLSSDLADHTVVYYFTGTGSAGQIDFIGSTDILNSDWLGDFFLNIANAFTHLIMQQNYAGSFDTAFSNIGSTDRTFTSACSDAENSSGDNTGSYFTDAWTSALRFNSYNGKYAYELSTVTDPKDPDNPAIGLLINLKQAWQFAKDKLASYPGTPSDTPVYTSSGDSKSYLGIPEFLIRDGDAPCWWESPDIYINQVGNDLYIQGQNNTVFINIKNTGTHPVWKFHIGSKHFGSGLAESDALVTDKIEIPTAPLKPGNTHEYQYTMMFNADTTHRCIRARAKLEKVTDNEINGWDDWSETLIQTNNFEAQRNIDPVTVFPSPPHPMPTPDQTENPDPDPQPDTGDENNTGDRSLWNIRGIKEHIYYVENPFKEKRKFRIVFGREFRKYSKWLDLGFYIIDEDKDTGRKYTPAKICSFPYPHISLELDKGGKTTLLFRFALKPETRITGELKLPVEILVNRSRRTEIINLRKSALRKPIFIPISGYVPVAGISVKIFTKELQIKGRVVDRNGKPVPEATIFIRTVNGKQAAVLKTSKDGTYIMPRINPDAYRMYAKTKEWKTKIRIINLFEKDLEVDFSEKEKE